MTATFDKCAIVIDEKLPFGLAMNTVAALSMSVGNFVDGIVGEDVKDGDGFTHSGITEIPVPILKGSAEDVRKVVLTAAEREGVFVVDFTAIAQSSRSYDEYTRRTSEASTAELPYIGVAVCGRKNLVNKLTGSLALYR